MFYNCVLRNDGIPIILDIPFPLFIIGMWCFSELFFVNEPQDVTVTRKDPVMLDCQAHGEIPIKVTWLKNGAKVSENKRIQVLSNGSLYISEVEGKRGEHSDEGFYQCLAMNKYGAILSQKAHLTLSSKCFKFLIVLHFSLLYSDNFSNHLYANPKVIQTLGIFLEILVDANKRHAEKSEGGNVNSTEYKS